MSTTEVGAKRSKSRPLSILDYIETLQLEFIIAELRHRIYPRLKDKNYWQRVMDGKKETIEKLATRNSLPTIFSDESMRLELSKKVYRENSYPLFTYRDDAHKMEQEYFDLRHYYCFGADVRVLVFDELKTGRITKEFIPFKDYHVFVTIEGVEDKYNISKVTRIL